MDRLTSIEALQTLRKRLKKEQDADKRPTVVVCGGTGCETFGGEALFEAFEDLVEKRQLQDKVRLKKTGCPGLCERGPLVTIRPMNIFYQKVKEQDASKILEETVLNGGVIQKLLYTDPNTNQKIVYEQDVPFYKKQLRIVLKHNGIIDPMSIEDYIAVGGYASRERVLTKMASEEVIEEIVNSGLRGRGGAGFSTGKKWGFVKNAPGDRKYLICNGDEGDPGAFMDRAVLEGNPHLVIEGMLIAAHAMGAQEGIFYIRAEYPLAVKHVGVAIQQARELGLLGKNVLGSEMSIDLRIKMGAGAFVCGEETALIASIEGKRGMPRTRPPFPAVSGLWGRPTCINNVETLANIAPIIESGAQWFSNIGTENSKGTKIFALAGNVRNTGLVEVPMGITLREIIFDIGGGIARKRAFKAAQMGGPSGGCIPMEHLETPIDYESLQKVGGIMGSGGLIVMDEKTSMPGMARYFMNFIQDESCGKCIPCRVGTRRMLEILNRINDGDGRDGDVELLEELGTRVKDTSLCGLGQTGPNPVLATIKYFRHEYDALIKGSDLEKAEKAPVVSKEQR